MFYRINDNGQLEYINLVWVAPGNFPALRLATDSQEAFCRFDTGEVLTAEFIYSQIEPDAGQIREIMEKWDGLPFIPCGCCEMPKELCLKRMRD